MYLEDMSTNPTYTVHSNGELVLITKDAESAIWTANRAACNGADVLLSEVAR